MVPSQRKGAAATCDRTLKLVKTPFENEMGQALEV
jgi:hypothetical protein